MGQVTRLVLIGVLVAVMGGGSSVGEAAPVFPGARGFGVQTPAGRGGKVIRVTNLRSTGPGSLREALGAKGPRIVVFEVGGVIDLEQKSITISEPFVTVAGQTAPSPGVTLIRGSVTITTHDVLIQHIRARPGDAGKAKRSGWEPDGISTSGGEAYNIVIDHCSISWAVDENLTASGPRNRGPDATSHKITFSHCIIAEGLNNSSHRKGRHSKGSLIHDNCRDIAVIGNLYAHNVARNPYFKAFTTGVVVNNVIYNPCTAGIQVNWADKEWEGEPVRPEPCRISVVGNVMIHGANTRKGLALVASRGSVYMKDNVNTDRKGKPVALTSGQIGILEERPVWPAGLEPLPSSEVVEHVCRHAGARPKDRDEVDRRIVRQFRQRRGRLIDSQDDVGGYPKCEMTRRELDVPTEHVGTWLARLARELE